MPDQAKQQRFSLITDKGLADLRQLIGVPIEDTLEPWCQGRIPIQAAVGV
jgi:hypothetical protein